MGSITLRYCDGIETEFNKIDRQEYGKRSL